MSGGLAKDVALDVKGKLARLREQKAVREQADKDARDLRELEILELEERFVRELGARGAMFEVVDSVEGPVVVSLGEAVLFKRFSESKMEMEDAAQFVTPCIVFPSREKFTEIVGRRPVVLTRCATALGTLFGLKREADAGKF